MLETQLREALLAHAPLMAALGNRPGRVDLVDVAEGTPPPYITFNLMSTERIGRANLCDPAALGLLRSVVLFTPWAGEAITVHQLNLLVRQALAASGQPNIVFESLTQWAREPETNLLTRGQRFAVQHTE